MSFFGPRSRRDEDALSLAGFVELAWGLSCELVVSWVAVCLWHAFVMWHLSGALHGTEFLSLSTAIARFTLDITVLATSHASDNLPCFIYVSISFVGLPPLLENVGKHFVFGK